jgi:hypothetical protein
VGARHRRSPRNSAIDLLIQTLPGTPVLTVTGAANTLGRSFRAAIRAIEDMVESGVLKQVRVGKRNRAFEAVEIIDAFTRFERQLASPSGDKASGAE